MSVQPFLGGADDDWLSRIAAKIEANERKRKQAKQPAPAIAVGQPKPVIEEPAPEQPEEKQKRSLWQSAQEQALQETEHALGVSRKDTSFDWKKARDRAVQIYTDKMRGLPAVTHPRQYATMEEAARMTGEQLGQVPVAGRVVTGIAQAGGDIAGTLATGLGAIGIPGMEKAGERFQSATEALGQGTDEEAKSYMGQMLQGAVRSLASQFLGYTTGVKGAQYLAPVLTQASQSYNEGKQEGLQGKDLLGYTLANASAEAIYALATKGLGQKLGIPLEGVEDMRNIVKGGLREFGRKFGWGMFGELTEEELTTFQQALARHAYGTDPKAMNPQQFFDTAVQTVLMMGLAKSPTFARVGQRALKHRAKRYAIAKEILQQSGVEATRERTKLLANALASNKVQRAISEKATQQQQLPEEKTAGTEAEQAAPPAVEGPAQEQIQQPEAQVVPPEEVQQVEQVAPPQVIEVKPEDLDRPVVEPPKVEEANKNKLLGTAGVKAEARGNKLANKIEVIVLRGPNGEDITPTKEERVQNIESDEFLSQLEYELEQLRKAGVSNAAVEQFRKSALFGAIDQMTGMQAANLRTPAMNRVIQWAEQRNQPASYAEIDVRNLGGLNAKLGHTGANKVYSTFAKILRDELTKELGKRVQFFRHGGDEMSVIGMGVNSETLSNALQKAQDRISQYVHDEGLADIPHPKHKNDLKYSGTGVEYETTEVQPGASPDEIFAAADIALEAKKVGGPKNVQRGEIAAAEPVAPEGQAAGTAEGVARPVIEAAPEGGTAEQVAPAASVEEQPERFKVYNDVDRIIKSNDIDELRQYRGKIVGLITKLENKKNAEDEADVARLDRILSDVEDRITELTGEDLTDYEFGVGKKATDEVKHSDAMRSKNVMELHRHRKYLRKKLAELKSKLEKRPGAKYIAAAKEDFSRDVSNAIYDIRLALPFKSIDTGVNWTQEQYNKALDVAHDILVQWSGAGERAAREYLPQFVDEARLLNTKADARKAKNEAIRNAARQLLEQDLKPDIDNYERMLDETEAEIERLGGKLEPISKMSKKELIAEIVGNTDKTERALKTYSIMKLRSILKNIRENVQAKPQQTEQKQQLKSIEQRINEATTLDEIDAIADEVDKAGQLAKYEKALDHRADLIMEEKVAPKKEKAQVAEKQAGTVEERLKQAKTANEIREIADTLDEREWERYADTITKRLDEVSAVSPFVDVEKNVDELLKDESLTPNQRRELEESKRRAKELAEEQRKLIAGADEEELRKELRAFGHTEKELADKRADELRNMLDEEMRGMMEAPGGMLRTPETERKKMEFWAGEALRAMASPGKFAHEIRKIAKKRREIRRRVTKIQQQINRVTGVKKVDESGEVVRTKAQLYKMIMRAKQAAGNLGYKVGMREGKKIAKEKAEAKQREAEDWQNTLLGFAKELPVAVRGKAMDVVLKATTPAKAAAALKRIDVLQAQNEHKKLVKQANKTIARLRKLYGKDLIKMNPVYRDMIADLIDGLDKGALSKKSRQVAEKLRELSMSDEELPVRLNKKNVKLMERLDKIPIATLDSDELEALLERLQTIHHRQRLYGKLFYRGKLRSAEKDAQEIESLAEEAKARNLAVGGKGKEWIEPRGALRNIADAVTKTKLKLELMDMMKGSGPGNRILNMFRESRDKFYLNKTNAKNDMIKLLDEYGVRNKESERKMHENVNVKLADGTILRLPRSVLVSLALTAKDDKGRRMLLRSPIFLTEVDDKSRYHRGIKAIMLGKPERKGERVHRYDLAEQDIAEIEKAAKEDKIANAYVDLWNKLRDKYFYNWVNEATLKTEGHELRHEGNWFPLRRRKGDVEPRGIDDYQAGYDMIRDWASRKERTGAEGYPIEIRPIHEILDEVLQHSAMINAYAETHHNIQTLLGRDDVRNNLDRIHGKGFTASLKKELMDAIGTDRDRIEMGKQLSRIANKFKGKATASILLANIPTWLAQPLSYIEAGTIINPRYLFSPDVLSGERTEQNKRVLDAIRNKNVSPKLWARKEGQAFDREVADVLRSDRINEIMAGEERLRDWYGRAIAKPMSYFDDVAISRIILAAHKQAQAELGKGPMDKAVLKRAAELAEHAVEETQPDNERLNRNPISKSAHGLARLIWSFRGYQDANLNNIMRAYYTYKYSNRTEADAMKLASRLALTLPLPLLLNALRKHGWKAVLGYLAALFGSKVAEDKKKKDKAGIQSIAAKAIDELSGKVPVVGNAIGYAVKQIATPKAVKPWDERRASEILGPAGQYLVAPGRLAKAIQQGRLDNILREAGIIIGRSTGAPIEGITNIGARILKPEKKKARKRKERKLNTKPFRKRKIYSSFRRKR